MDDQIKFLISISGDAPSDYKFTREVIRFLFATWECFPTQSSLKAARPSLLTTIQTMLMERITYFSRNSSEFTERSKKERLSKLISNSLYTVKASGENENGDDPSIEEDFVTVVEVDDPSTEQDLIEVMVT